MNLRTDFEFFDSENVFVRKWATQCGFFTEITDFHSDFFSDFSKSR